VDDGRRLMSALQAVTERLPCRWPRTVIATSRAALAEREGDRVGAESHFVDALRLHTSMEMPLADVETLIRYGGFLRRGRELRRARAALARALEIAEGVGAGRLAGLARAELGAAGGRRRHKPVVDELTPAESRVAELAREGLSDKQIARHLTISVKTVEAHLQHVYRKLGVNSRRELMRQSITSSP
jgi:DNA-binding CsgD family transcriptional regulator